MSPSTNPTSRLNSAMSADDPKRKCVGRGGATLANGFFCYRINRGGDNTTAKPIGHGGDNLITKSSLAIRPGRAQPQAPVAERVASRSRLQIAEGAMGSSRSISSHCDSKTLAAINLAFEGAWNVLETRDLLARFANNCELQAELGQRLVVLSDLPKGSNSMRAILHANFTDDVARLSCTSDSSTRDPQLRDSSVDGFEPALTSARDAWQAKGSSSSRSARTTTYSARVVRHR